MSPKKLTDEDKQEILKLYRQTPETTSTLAERFGVSSSTISRFLKSCLAETEYEELIQEKRLARTPRSSAAEPQSEVPVSSPSTDDDFVEPEEPLLQSAKSIAAESTRQVSVSSGKAAAIRAQPTQFVLPLEVPPPDEPDPEDVEIPDVDVFALGDLLGEDLSDLDDDDDELDADDEDDDWEEEPITHYLPALPRNADIRVLPLSAASFPKTCYLVIDRASELITRPLKEFSHLGKIPVEEVQQKTLPVFDNHRVARRFSNRSQRVIKVPDGRLLQKTCAYLYGKGITRILMDGQIYSLSAT